MADVLSPVEEQRTAFPSKAKAPQIKFQSIWVLIGFTFWFGFYLGAIIMHTVTK